MIAVDDIDHLLISFVYDCNSIQFQLRDLHNNKTLKASVEISMRLRLAIFFFFNQCGMQMIYSFPIKFQMKNGKPQIIKFKFLVVFV